MVFEYYNDFYKHVLTEEDYEKNRIQVYKFLVDAAGDGFVTPSILPWTKKLVEERMSASQNVIEGEGILMDEYRNRKLLDYYLEPIAIKHELTIDEIRVLFYLIQGTCFTNRKELSDFIGIGNRAAAIMLQRLLQKKMVRVTKKRNQEQLTIRFLEEAESVLPELKDVQYKVNQARLDGFTETELEQYQLLDKKIRQNIQNILQ